MKRKELNSNRKLKTEMGACAQVGSGFVPSAASTVRRRARRAQLGVAALRVGGPTTTHMDVTAGSKRPDKVIRDTMPL
jgi:hypothetical protein